MQIRKIEPRDFATVVQLENENWPVTSTPIAMNSTVEKIMDKILKGNSYFLAEENGQILGVLDYGPHNPSPFSQHVVTFGVMTVEAARGKGVATTLIDYFIDFAHEEGYKKITIRAMGSNPDALKLYKKLGFVEEGRLRKEFYINGQYIDDCFLAYYLDEF